MLSWYIKSAIIYFIIFIAIEKLGKFIIANRTDVNYKDYLTGNVKGKISIFTVSLIPVIRFIYIIIMIIIIFGDKQLLDKIFKKEAEEQK